ncbi:hypothetical protein [Acinetobacter colistiniresistens]|uniref:hypothetical protein n=1 Tax=Acinetobacter colistiniresistens TaxID=280145 RepID=UPI0012509CA7|nr:hypothetical protein [Acinetobacter colistiniresistens]
MLRPVNPIVSRVTEAKRRAARSSVLTSPSTLDCMIFEKQIDQPNTDEQRNEIYGDVEMLGSSDEQAFSYVEKGFAKLLLEKFNGGTIFKDSAGIDGFEQSFYGQIEPVIPDLERRQQLIQVPDWQIKNNDVLAVIITAERIIYLEVVSPDGQAFVDDFGTKYRLNKRDDFNFIEPFTEYPYDIQYP